jgi:sulfide dehydrogenase cytochrome subunit
VTPLGRSTPGRQSRPASLRPACRLAAYALLAAAPAAADITSPDILASGCTGCHGPDGVSTGEALPSIAGLDKLYLARVMVQFKNEERPSTIMGRIAKGFTDSELRTMAKHFGGLPWQGGQSGAGTPDLAEARQIHEKVCAECHEQGGRHQDRDTPRIAGQGPDYLFLSLQQYRNPEGKAKLPQPDKMLDALKPLSDSQLLGLSHYYASQK